MPSAEVTTHSFIVTIWLDEPPSRTEAALWRGRITHVPSGDSRYFQDFGHISRFIGSYLPDASDHRTLDDSHGGEQPLE